MLSSRIRDRLLHPDLVREFVAEFQREFNRLQSRRELELSSKLGELRKVERSIRCIIEAVKDGLYDRSMISEMKALEAAKATLEAETSAQPAPSPRLHPGLADIYRRKVAELTHALNVEPSRADAAAAIRSLLETIKLTPEGDKLAIELVGELAGILSLGTEKKSPRADDAGATMVAGTGFEPVTFRL